MFRCNVRVLAQLMHMHFHYLNTDAHTYTHNPANHPICGVSYISTCVVPWVYQCTHKTCVYTWSYTVDFHNINVVVICTQGVSRASLQTTSLLIELSVFWVLSYYQIGKKYIWPIIFIKCRLYSNSNILILCICDSCPTPTLTFIHTHTHIHTHTYTHTHTHTYTQNSLANRWQSQDA